MTKTMTAGELLRKQLDAALPDGGEWDERESAILDLASRQANDIAALELLLEQEGPSVTGSTGQARMNPAFAELRQQRLALTKILDSIKLPDEGMGVAKNVKAQRAAHTRWNRTAG